MSAATKRRGHWGRLYHGETNIDIIGRTKLWFGISIIFLLIGRDRRCSPAASTWASTSPAARSSRSRQRRSPSSRRAMPSRASA